MIKSLHHFYYFITSCFRAADENRTRDIQLGRLTLYQLSYHRFNRRSRRRRRCIKFATQPLEKTTIFLLVSITCLMEQVEDGAARLRLAASAGEVGVVRFELTQR